MLKIEFNVVKATQWNKEVKHARECKDHPLVTGTDYMQVHRLLGTNGCSKEEPYWDWSVMGVIRNHRGELVTVNPGDYILEVTIPYNKKEEEVVVETENYSIKQEIHSGEEKTMILVLSELVYQLLTTGVVA